MTILQMVVIQKRTIKEKPLFIFKRFKILNHIFIPLSSKLVAGHEIKIKNGTAKIIQKGINPIGQNNLIFTIKLIGIDDKIDGYIAHHTLFK
jgi:hypothetical protein